MKIRKKRIRPEQIIIFSFAAVILIGALLLMMPWSHTQQLSFIDALFTATSATCVTGLVVQNTATFWTSLGHIIILCMIQVGGLGVITIAILLTVISGRKIDLGKRTLMQEAINAPQVGGIVRLTNFLVKGVFLIEIIGAVLLFVVFKGDYGTLKGIWFSIFHSISAFCNAGFDILSTPDTAGSLCMYAFNPYLITVICLLIVIGGIGFLTWHDVVEYKYHFKRYRLQSKVVLVTTLILIVFPFLYFFFYEYQTIPASQRVWVALMQTITMRTAGFNSIDLNETSEAGQLLMIVLMLIGGASGSTAGGMKVSTIAMVVLGSFAIFFKRSEVNVFQRRIAESTILNAMAIFMMYIIFFVVGGFLISRIENLPLLTCLFESASAIGTVGVTLGITSSLHTASKIIIIIMMFLGRVGGLTFIYATISSASSKSKFPQEKVVVG